MLISIIIIIVGNGIKGYLSNAPYDAIHVGAAVKVLPQAVIQLHIKFDLFLSVVYFKVG